MTYNATYDLSIFLLFTSVHLQGSTASAIPSKCVPVTLHTGYCCHHGLFGVATAVCPTPAGTGTTARFWKTGLERCRRVCLSNCRYNTDQPICSCLLSLCVIPQFCVALVCFQTASGPTLLLNLGAFIDYPPSKLRRQCFSVLRRYRRVAHT